ncbi:hypothetical protein DPMN_114815 [Dreissena polymorpha]|nr:hypothetical protein DPMN_114815 [Dreissena polymorpha]
MMCDFGSDGASVIVHAQQSDTSCQQPLCAHTLALSVVKPSKDIPYLLKLYDVLCDLHCFY